MDAVVTDIGLAKIAAATANNPLKITHFAVGDGGGSAITPTPDMTNLVNEEYRDYVNDVYASDNNTVVECVFRANAPVVGSFYIRELGIFDVDGDMIAIAQTPEQYRPAAAEGIATE
jgi:phage-related tail fiber protein